MGSKGIKPRKPRRRLRRLKRLRIEDSTPGHVMWPEKGSGFDASPWSPAGRAQQGWMLSVRAAKGDRRALLLVMIPLLPIGVWLMFTLAEMIGSLFR